MKKHYLLLLTVVAFTTVSFAQLTGTKNIPGDYTTLALAITDLNAQGVGAGGVTLNLVAVTPQIAPAGGYVIGNAGNILAGGTNPTAANPVIIEGNGNSITAFTPQASGNLNDAIFKIIGADYITIQNFTMQENAANTTTAEATNTMTEWGVALLRVSTTNGAQNNTIKNNTISLNRTYQNSFGIYSNVMHSATAVTTLADITNVSGSNFGNKIYSNAISNVGTGMVFVGSATAAFMDNGNDIGGSSAVTGNTVTNWGAINVPVAAYIDISTSSICILVDHQVNENVSYNTITSAAVSIVTFNVVGIAKTYYSGQPSGTITSVINNNTITLSSSNVSAGYVEGIFNQDITDLGTATLTMNNNTIVNCIISGVGATTEFIGIGNESAPGILNISNNTIRGNTSSSTGGGFFGIYNQGAVVTTINITGNKIGDAIAGAITFSAATTGVIRCITNYSAAATATININNNSVDGVSAITSGETVFIINSGATAVSVNMNNNSLGTATGNLITFNGAQSANLFGLYNANTTGTCVITIQGNDIRGIVHSVTGSAFHQYIRSQTAAASVNILSNTFTNLNVNTTGGVYFMQRDGDMTATGVSNCNNNSIVTAFNKSASGNSVYFFHSGSSSVSGSAMTEMGNNFSNVTVTGSTNIGGWYNTEGATFSGPTKTITGNSFNNITGGSGLIGVMFTYFGAGTTCSSNTISNISSTGDIYGIYQGISNGPGTYSSNSITGLSSTGANAFIVGIEVDEDGTVNINDNVINNLSGSGTLSPVANGILVSSGTTVNVFKNKIYNITESGAISTTSPAVNGIVLSGGTANTVYNNFISDLKATNASLTDAIRGISISTGSFSTNNLYYNSVYLNAVSSGTNFGTSGIYQAGSATSTTATLNLIDNIIVNTSTANGTGVTAAFRRSNTLLDNYAATSDYNLFYAGTPGAKNLILYDGSNADQTLTAYQALVSTRDANSISLMPNFISSTDLHLSTVNCRIDGRGTPVVVTTDIDGATRDITTPDIGADEFSATFNTVLAGVIGSPVCEDRTVSVTGTTYTSNDCDLIAKLTPSGGTAVSGKVNVCVTLDATQQYFNAEPYVKRHFDIEPVVNPSGSTATITLYYADSEFVAYNTANPPWPKLPTVAGGANADPNKAKLRVTQFHGATTTTPSAPGTYPGTEEVINPGPANIFWNGTYWEITFPVTAFSGFYVHSTIFNTPLSITVNYFNGIKQTNGHLLNWKVTCNNTPTVTMVLERSTDGINYNGIYTVTATALQCQQPFNYTDAQPAAGINYYRLKMSDVNDKITYSSIVSLINATNGFDIMAIAPNPILNGSFKLNVSAAQKMRMDIMVTDMLGRLMQKQTVSMIAGFNTIPMNVTNLAAGTYQVVGISADGRSKALRFVIQ